jgi:hypothetical protein
LPGYKKDDGSRMVYLSAIIDRKPTRIPLKFYVKEESFNMKGQCMRPNHPNKKDFDTEFITALAKANTIASKFRRENKMLTPEVFRNEYQNPTEELDFIKRYSN